MKNTPDIAKKLIDIKHQISELGIAYLDYKSPVRLDDVGNLLKPFIKIDDAINQGIKKFSSDNNPGIIPKQNTLKS